MQESEKIQHANCSQLQALNAMENKEKYLD